jgi:hypothetical protein
MMTNDKIKVEFIEKTDNELINHVKNGTLSHYKSMYLWSNLKLKMNYC